jgi:DNA replication and repair protein RecF
LYVSHLSLTDFRSYPQVELPLERGVTTLLGSNGQGKTNLVEAVCYLATLSSHRVSTDAPLVRGGAERAVVRAQAHRGERSLLVELEIVPGKANRARINRAPAGRPREILGVIRTVLFAPEDLALVKGDPTERRRFLDELIILRTPRLAGVRADYDRVLKQRNTLLKSAGAARRNRSRGASSSTGASAPGVDLSTLDVWDGHLATYGAELIAARLELIEVLRPRVEKAYAALVAGGASTGRATGLDYRGTLSAEALVPDRAALQEALLTEMQAVRPQELERGVSLVGPHRDDVVLTLGEFPAKGYASHGESWSFALALRLACYDTLREEGEEPVLLLDDVFAELDSHRRSRLAELVAPAEQVLVTAAVEGDVPEVLRGDVFEVRMGEVRRAR